MLSTEKKLITIPEARPLWAMAKCFGPTEGPLLRPTPTPIPIIGELLQQKGKESLTIYEVIARGRGYSAPVQLTLNNYTLPYDEIVENKTSPTKPVVEPVKPAEKPVAPEVVEAPNAAVPEEVPAEISPITKEPATPETPMESTDKSVEETKDADPYAGMTKKQRRVARRQAEQENSLLEVLSGND